MNFPSEKPQVSKKAMRSVLITAKYFGHMKRKPVARTRNSYPVEYLKWSFFAKIVNGSSVNTSLYIDSIDETFGRKIDGREMAWPFVKPMRYFQISPFSPCGKKSLIKCQI